MEKRRFWWGLRPCGSSHKTFLAEHAVWFFTELSEGLRLLFFWFEWWEKDNASRQGHRPPCRFSAFCRRVTVPRHDAHTSSEHPNVWKLCVDAHYPTGPNKAKQFPTAVWPTSLAPCFSRPQVIENHDSTVTSFQWIYFHSNTLQGCIHLATVIWQILSCGIIGLVLRPSLVGHKLELFTVVPLVLFEDDESGGDSICKFACFLFQVTELLFHKFCVSSTIFFWSSTQTEKSSRFGFPASSCLK